MLPTIQFRIFCLPVSSLKTLLKYTKSQFYLFFCVGLKLGLSHEGKNIHIDSGCLKTGCPGEYLDLRGRKCQEAEEDCIKIIGVISQGG
jgi:hypothetical protein